MEKRLEEGISIMNVEENGETIMSLKTSGDLNIRGTVFVGDHRETFEVGPVTCGGTIIADGLNAGKVCVTEDFLAKTANLEELNCGGDVEAEYLFCELGACVLGDICVEKLVSETHHVFCGGKFTGEFVGTPELLHEHFRDWSNVKNYI